MSKQALITLTPLDPYLFGGELTHGNGDGANYFSKGNPLPQQTTICGTLRHLLFKRGPSKSSRGPNSFTPDDPKLNDYGDLLSLSPLFLTDGAAFFLRQAIDRHEGDTEPFELSGEKPKEWILFDSGELPSEANSPAKWRNAHCWENFDPKKDLADYWVSPSGSPVKPSKIFKIFTRPGIPKKELRRPKINGPGLFKQQLYRLAPDWAFCVLAEFSDGVDLDELNHSTLPLGAEKAIFHISVQAEHRSFEAIFPPKTMFDRKQGPGQSYLVLTSDAWVTDDVWQFATAAVTETADFRHIRTHEQVKAFGRLHRWNGKADPTDQMAKSSKYTLLRRGSVLVTNPENLLGLQNALSVEPWRTIGYNHFFTYP